MIEFILLLVIIILLIIIFLQSKKIKNFRALFDNSLNNDLSLEFDNEEAINEFENVVKDLECYSKSDAIRIINQENNHYTLTTKNTRFSNINSTVPVWWFDIPPELFKNDLHLILKKKRSFFWLHIPQGTFEFLQDSFYIRPDNSKVQLRISTESGLYFMRDTAPGCKGVGFEKYIIKEFK